MDVLINDEEKKMFTEKAELLKALAHPVRLCIVKNLCECGSCNVSKIQSCLSMPQSTVSQHLCKLKALGIVEGKRNGTEIIYCVINPDARRIISSLLNETALC